MVQLMLLLSKSLFEAIRSIGKRRRKRGAPDEDLALIKGDTKGKRYYWLRGSKLHIQTVEKHVAAREKRRDDQIDVLEASGNGMMIGNRKPGTSFLQTNDRPLHPPEKSASHRYNFSLKVHLIDNMFFIATYAAQERFSLMTHTGKERVRQTDTVADSSNSEKRAKNRAACDTRQTSQILNCEDTTICCLEPANCHRNPSL